MFSFILIFILRNIHYMLLTQLHRMETQGEVGRQTDDEAGEVHQLLANPAIQRESK